MKHVIYGVKNEKYVTLLIARLDVLPLEWYKVYAEWMSRCSSRTHKAEGIV